MGKLAAPSASEPCFSCWCGFGFSGVFSPICYLKRGNKEGAVDAQKGMNGEQLRHRRHGWVPWFTIGMILGEGGGFGSFLAAGSSVFCPVGSRDSYVVFSFTLDVSSAVIFNTAMELCLLLACMPIACKRKRESQLLHWHRLHQLPAPRETSTVCVGAGGADHSSLSLNWAVIAARDILLLHRRAPRSLREVLLPLCLNTSQQLVVGTTRQGKLLNRWDKAIGFSLTCCCCFVLLYIFSFIKNFYCFFPYFLPGSPIISKI